MERTVAEGNPQQAQTVSTARRIAGIALLYLSRICMVLVLSYMLLAVADMTTIVLSKLLSTRIELPYGQAYRDTHSICFVVSLCMMTVCVGVKARRRKWAAIVVGAMLSVYICLFLITVQPLATQHLDKDVFYSLELLLLGILLLANIVGYDALLGSKGLLHWRRLSYACILVGIVCFFVALETPCCSGG